MPHTLPDAINQAISDVEIDRFTFFSNSTEFRDYLDTSWNMIGIIGVDTREAICSFKVARAMSAWKKK